ncbi:hypothetical protein P3G55_13750 [Leptospira sp. 96542]|nr:hypothetical protein [Leptospira sp. 96542]
MRTNEANESVPCPAPSPVLSHKIETFTNRLLASLSQKTKEDRTWAVLTMNGEVLAMGKRKNPSDLHSDSLF